MGNKTIPEIVADLHLVEYNGGPKADDTIKIRVGTFTDVEVEVSEIADLHGVDGDELALALFEKSRA